MKSCRPEIERLIPVLRQVARALVESHRPDIADDLVQEALEEAIRGERVWAVAEVETRLFTRLIGANRLRLRSETEQRRTLPGVSAHGEAPSSRSGSGSPAPRDGGRGLEALSLGDREALLLVVLGRLDYTKTADVLGVPLGTLVSRLTHARDALGTSLWSNTHGFQPRPKPGSSHLRLVKS